MNNFNEAIKNYNIAIENSIGKIGIAVETRLKEKLSIAQAAFK
jgi:hypothetical protein